MPKPELAPVPNISRADMETLQRSMTEALDAQYADMGEETRRQLLQNFEDILNTSFSIMRGITVQKFEKDKRTGDIEEVLYSVPPYWPAIKYFLDWFRQLAQLGVGQNTGRGIDPETTKMLKEFLQGQDDNRPNPPASQNGGVVVLGEYRDIEIDDDSGETETND